MKWLPLILLLFISCKHDSSKILNKPQTNFHLADKVVIVAFSERESPWKLSSKGNHNNQHGYVLQQPFLQAITLTQDQRNTLYHILSTPIGSTNEGADCYNPHHAILLYQKGVPFAYYEICFDCQRVEYSPDFGIPALTSGQYCPLYKFIKQIGITRETYVQDEWICH